MRKYAAEEVKRAHEAKSRADLDREAARDLLAQKQLERNLIAQGNMKKSSRILTK